MKSFNKDFFFLRNARISYALPSFLFILLLSIPQGGSAQVIPSVFYNQAASNNAPAFSVSNWNSPLIASTFFTSNGGFVTSVRLSVLYQNCRKPVRASIWTLASQTSDGLPDRLLMTSLNAPNDNDFGTGSFFGYFPITWTFDGAAALSANTFYGLELESEDINGNCFADFLGGGDVASGKIFVKFPSGWIFGTDSDFVMSVNGDPLGVISAGQYKSDGALPIQEGTITSEDAVIFKGSPQNQVSNQAKIQVELRPLSELFTGIFDGGIIESGFVQVGTEASISRPGLVDDFYHWRIRSVDVQGNASAWQEFGNVGNDDFIVKTVPLYTQIQSSHPSDEATLSWAQIRYGNGSYPDCADSALHFSSIQRCGCAITSAVMLMRYYGITVGTDGNDVNPLTLNAWLTQNGGYDQEGSLNWTALVPYANKSLTFDGVRNSYDTATLDSYLSSDTPVILREDSIGHFLLADGKLSTTYTVRDPRWYNTRFLSQSVTDLNTRDYGNSFDGLRLFSFAPNNSATIGDISFALGSPAELLVTDAFGNRLGKDPRTGSVFNEISGGVYYSDGISAADDTPLPPHEIKKIWIPNAIPGIFNVQVIGTGQGGYKLDSFSYDAQGVSHAQIFSGNTFPNFVTKYDLNFTPQSPQTILTVPEDTVPPVISHTDLLERYLLNATSTQFIFSATDSGVGVFSVSAELDGKPLASGGNILFDAPGSHIVTIVAEDFMSNIASSTLNFNVVYNFGGFLSPKEKNGVSHLLGVPIPVRFSLTDAHGHFIKNATAHIFIAKINEGVVGPDQVPRDGANTFRYDDGVDQYVYSLGTRFLQKGAWQIKALLDDGNAYITKILLK